MKVKVIDFNDTSYGWMLKWSFLKVCRVEYIRSEIGDRANNNNGDKMLFMKPYKPFQVRIVGKQTEQLLKDLLWSPVVTIFCYQAIYIDLK